MSDLGMRVSMDGIDVKTGLDKEMVMTSKYALLKGTLSGTGTVSVARDGTPEVVTIPHGLGYIPFVQASFSDTNQIYWNTDNYIFFPLYDFDGTTEFVVKASADATNVYLTFIVADLTSRFGNYSSGTTNYNWGDESPARVLLNNTFTAISGDVLESISFYAKKNDANEDINVSLYRIESGLPTTKFGAGIVTVDSTTMQIWTVSMGSAALTAGHTYGVAIGGFGGNESGGVYNTTIPMDAGSGNEVSCREVTEQSLPASWDHDNYRSTIPALWATITRAAIDIDYTYTIFIDKGKL